MTHNLFSLYLSLSLSLSRIVTHEPLDEYFAVMTYLCLEFSQVLEFCYSLVVLLPDSTQSTEQRRACVVTRCARHDRTLKPLSQPQQCVDTTAMTTAVNRLFVEPWAGSPRWVPMKPIISPCQGCLWYFGLTPASRIRPLYYRLDYEKWLFMG